MSRKLLYSSVAVIALCFSLPALADTATVIQQGGENGGYAYQNQPGVNDGSGDSATITQTGGTGDSATQQQARGGFPSDYAGNSTEIITQTGNTGYVSASQEDNSGGTLQTINQTTNYNTSATQTINAPNTDSGAPNNTQTATQTSRLYSRA